MKTPLLVCLMLGFATLPLLPASALVDQCSVRGLVPGIFVPPFAQIPASLSWLDGTCAGTGLHGLSPPCPASSTPLVLPGEYCGLTYPTGGLVSCLWFPIGASTVGTIYMGFDTNADGNVDSLDPPLTSHGLGPNLPVAVVAPPGGRLIVYPQSTLIGGSLLDLTVVECL